MNKLKKITFTGVDDTTDIDRLVDLQKRYPFAEFGILLSSHYATNGHRYPDPTLFGKIAGKGLNLSLHVCGRLARKACLGNWDAVKNLVVGGGGTLDMFDRIQLNISSMDDVEQIDLCECPFVVDQIILQQKSESDCRTYKKNEENRMFAMLCDMSGGRGVYDENFTPYVSEIGQIVGYAGGIGEKNVLSRLGQIEESQSGPYWIDMESSLRNNKDAFDLDTISRILEMVESWKDREGLE